ncbi:hypothetical protein C0J45_22169 [Silurus meridionalis]|nr:hypothetical protein C0J45_22169 [Silurus meridionalis]
MGDLKRVYKLDYFKDYLNDFRSNELHVGPPGALWSEREHFYRTEPGLVSPVDLVDNVDPVGHGGLL